MSAEALGLVRVLSPHTDTELAAIVEVLEARQVPCFVSQVRSGTGHSGRQGPVSKPRAILVPAAKLAEALAILGDLPGSQAACDGGAREPTFGWLYALVRRP
jgi:hypothetical protein